MNCSSFCSQKSWEQFPHFIVSNSIRRHTEIISGTKIGWGKPEIVKIKANIDRDGPFRAFGMHHIVCHFLLHDFNRSGSVGNSRSALCGGPGLRRLPCRNRTQISLQPPCTFTHQRSSHDRHQRLRILPWPRQRTYPLRRQSRAHHQSRQKTRLLFSVPSRCAG